MKKFLLFSFALLTLFTACSDDDDNESPIAGLKMPEFENPVKPGASITIQGEGFTQASEIWFRQIVSKAADNGDVQATVTEVTATGITFTAPEVYGNQTVLLKENGKEYELGKMVFEEEPAAGEGGKILPKRIKRILCYEDNGQLKDSYEYNYDADGRIISCKMMKDEEKYIYSENKITIKNEVYEKEYNFVLENGRIKSYRYDNIRYNESENGTVTYEGDYLNKVNGVWKDDDGEWAFTETFSFSNGNMTMYKLEADDGYINVEFTYGKQSNNLNINLFYFLDCCDGYIGMALQFDTTIGKRSHYLPSSMKVSEWDGDEGGSYTTYLEYEMDGEYITKITSKDDDDGYTEILVIEYE